MKHSNQKDEFKQKENTNREAWILSAERLKKLRYREITGVNSKPKQHKEREKKTLYVIDLLCRKRGREKKWKITHRKTARGCRNLPDEKRWMICWRSAENEKDETISDAKRKNREVLETP